MGQITDRAAALAELLDVDGVRATTDIRDTVPPCLLVVPIPVRDYTESVLAGSQELTWTLVALGRPPADLEAAKDLEELVDHAVIVLEDGITRCEPAAYTIPGAETSVPAYLITYVETAQEV